MHELILADEPFGFRLNLKEGLLTIINIRIISFLKVLGVCDNSASALESRRRTHTKVNFLNFMSPIIPISSDDCGSYKMMNLLFFASTKILQVFL